jgi:general secretion pathway protein D
MNSRHLAGLALMFAVVLLAGCPKGGTEYNAGKKAEAINDYDTALEHYNNALRAEPTNTDYKLKAMRARFEAAQWHVDQGRRLREQGNLQLALAEFQKAAMIDPSSPVAAQEVQATLAEIRTKQGTENPPSASPSKDEADELAAPPQLKPISRAPINMRATNDAKAIFDAIGKLAGLTVIFDPDFTSRRISVELTNVTLEQALDVVALQSKTFWRPVTTNIIFVAPDQAQKRREYEEEVVKTFYLHNTVQPQELTEIVTSIRQLLDLRRVQQINSQNAIVVRDTPDRVLLAQRIIDSIDKAKPEVVVQVAILQARRDRLRNLGIQPGTTAQLAFTPNGTSTTSSSTTGTSTTTNSIPLNQLQHLSTSDYSLTLPGAQASFLMTDSSTKILDNPEIRVVDGQTAKLRVGDRVPVATGSFQAGVGVGTTGTGAGVINPLVNTQFQYLDVGVNVDVTPRVHPDHEISMKVNVVVSSVTGQQNIGGISQPIISQRSIEHDVRLKDGEVNILGGLIERTDTTTITGWPGLAKLPFFRYFFSGENTEHQENEVLIVLIPHIVRLPTITAEDLRAIASGTDTNAAVSLEEQVNAPPVPKSQTITPPPAPTPAPPAEAAQAPGQAPATQSPELSFAPASVTLRPGQTATIGVVVQNAQDLYSIPMLLQFNPAVISIDDVRQGGFLSGGTQQVAIVERVDRERGQAIISATRMPNTPGVSGSGTLLGIVVRGVAAGTSQISVVQVNAKDSQQRPIQFLSKEATVQVQ